MKKAAAFIGGFLSMMVLSTAALAAPEGKVEIATRSPIFTVLLVVGVGCLIAAFVVSRIQRNNKYKRFK
ncbi:MAG: hypothetical protein IJP30_03275 [Clostridia bacterium]|nr:hypothetical protein [Clostridia bacterium]